MEYRSDVYMCIKGPTKSILAGIATLRLEGDTAMHEALDEWNVTACSETHATMVLGGQGRSWKWYESYPDVQAHHKIYNYFQDQSEEDSELDGTFVRIGEDDADIFTTSFNEGCALGVVERNIFRAYEGTGEDLRPSIAAQQQAEEAVHNLTSLDDMKKTL